VAVSPAGGGTTDPAVGTHTYAEDTVVDVTATPATGYEFDHWSGACTGTGACQVTMDADKSVTAHFTLLPVTYDLTIAVSPAGDGTTDPAVGTHTYAEDTVVDVTATPATGYEFDHWSGACTGTGACQVTMDADKSVTAHFTQITPEQYTLTVNVVGNGSVTLDPAGGTYVQLIPVHQPVSRRGATLDIIGSKYVEPFPIRQPVAKPDVALDTVGGTYAAGTVVQLTVDPAAGWSFAGWSGPDAGDLVNTGGGTWSITMDEDKSLTATFTQDDGKPPVSWVSWLRPVQYGPVFTVSWMGYDPGGSGIQCYDVQYKDGSGSWEDWQTCTTATSASFNYGQPGHLYYFRSRATDNAGNVEAWPGQFDTWTYVWTQGGYTLAVSVVGNGSVSKDPNQSIYSYGQEVKLTATAGPGWMFDHWSGNLTGSANPATITMNGNKTVTAHFTEIAPEWYTLSVNAVGNGSVSKDPDQVVYSYGQDVELTATADPGWTFDHWSGDLTGSANPATITMDGDKTVTAYFTEEVPPEWYTLSVNVVGNGSVTLNPAGSTYAAGTVVQLTVDPAAGWSFAGWSGPDVGDLVNTGGGTWSITMDEDKSLTATFTAGDGDPPISSVKPLKPTTYTSVFTVRWTGYDPGGSGIQCYDVQYKDRFGSWKDWQTCTTATSAEFHGQRGQMYYFRSRATDNAGNVEAWPWRPDTWTYVWSWMWW
jgi:uncharacterized repeat protein (TIGR02543 family)